MNKPLKIIGRELLFNQTPLPGLPLRCHALWKFGNSKCCIFKMKDTTGLETSTKIYVIGHLQPVIHKNSERPRYFDFRIWWHDGEKTLYIERIIKISILTYLKLGSRGQCEKQCCRKWYNFFWRNWGMMALNDKETVKVKTNNVSSNPCQSKISFAWNIYLLLLIFYLE